MTVVRDENVTVRNQAHWPKLDDTIICKVEELNNARLRTVRYINFRHNGSTPTGDKLLLAIAEVRSFYREAIKLDAITNELITGEIQAASSAIINFGANTMTDKPGTRISRY
jgi:hypothetical protein